MEIYSLLTDTHHETLCTLKHITLNILYIYIHMKVNLLYYVIIILLYKNGLHLFLPMNSSYSHKHTCTLRCFHSPFVFIKKCVYDVYKSQTSDLPWTLNIFIAAALTLLIRHLYCVCSQNKQHHLDYFSKSVR